MIPRSCRSYLYQIGSRNIRAAILFIVAVAILLAARDYLHSPGKVPYKTQKVMKWNPAHNKDLFLIPAVRPKVHHVKPIDKSEVMAKLAQARGPLEHPLLALQSHVGQVQKSKEDEAMVEYIATKTKVEIGVLTNMEDDWTCWLQVTLTNTGKATISYGHWEIYFHSIRFLQIKDRPYPSGILIKDTAFRLFHVQGSLYRLVPENGLFINWPAGKEITLHLEAKAFLISRSDFFPNWYVTAPKVKPLLIQSTVDGNLSFVQPFDTSSKWKRNKQDQYNPFTAEDRFNRNLVIRDLGHQGSYVTPTPVQVSFDPITKVVMDTKTWQIFHNGKFSKEINYLADLFKMEVSSVQPLSKYIQIVEKKVFPLKHAPTTVKEAYTVEVTPDVVTLAASDTAGAFYAAVTLYSLTNRVNTGLWEVPVGKVIDQPRFRHRGLHLDVARNFRRKDEILRLLDVMAIYKLNKLHLHLSDDEGWRIEILGLPELTQVGSRRCHGDSKCLFPQLGSGPEAEYPGTGYYTVNDYCEILRHADALHIQIIPEIDMPGHSQAAIKAMEVRYYDLQEKGRGLEARQYLLSDLSDKSDYLSVQSFKNSAINPCLESTYSFLHHVIMSLKALHSDIQPLTFYHFGGDEVPKGAWVNSSACDTSSLQPDVHNMQKWKEYFLKRIFKMAEQENLKLGVWEDGIIDQNTTEPYNNNLLGAMSGNVFTYPWNNKWEYGMGNEAYKLANAGYKVVMSLGTHLYFDHSHEPDPEEVGLYWATRFIDLHHVFSFTPEQIYWNAELSGMGEPLNKDQICNSRECLTLQKPENIVGMECHLWGELLRSRDITDHQMFPRVIAMAERAWHQAVWESEGDVAARRTQTDADWLRFANTIGYKEYPYLDSLGIKYRIPPPGAVVQERKLLVNSEAPGLEIQYSLDFGKTWRDARGGPELTGDATIFLRTMSTDKTRWSRIIKLQYDHDQVKVKQRAMDGQIKESAQQQKGIELGPSQQQIGQGKSQQQIMPGQSQQQIGQGKSQKQIIPEQSQQLIGQGKYQKQIVPEQSLQLIGQGKSQKQTVPEQSQQQIGQGKSQQQIVPEQSQQQIGQGKSHQPIVPEQSQRQIGQGKYQKQIVPEQSQQLIGQGKSQKQTVPEQSQQQIGQGKSRQQIVLGQSQQQIVPGQFTQQVRQGKPILPGQPKMLRQQQAGQQIPDEASKQQIQLKVLQENVDAVIKMHIKGKTSAESNLKVNTKLSNVRESSSETKQIDKLLEQQLHEANLRAVQGKSKETLERRPDMATDNKPLESVKIQQGVVDSVAETRGKLLRSRDKTGNQFNRNSQKFIKTMMDKVGRQQ
ncbi:uncharacterized protein LOC110451484 [Mizuhopecten yessoensis]|uniref:beta-N-acetylhexosaminidase n=1 Tax=Mizuhopecten yessoensis TaxID=6573 RepID=A0A210QLJ4_MIZYE|nr:uncharacterized protein LOC110451484 [Mizuhopecten yessoensis]XP_021355199.1 uncharacterized protein LOC110451484 [Mizuhopecten yessoensis]XP_021355200.1 uncharacterized protein LOC110451484 [Mizuhopecten yessoensis]XP_021355202.1 uncharacterized protein LOC110451484 [Mizuhopecten yessoensis]OWF49612.1 Chitobiase [Mizuhopecten yessoensis]